MAEQDFDIKIRTTADATGIKQTEAGLSNLSQVGGALGLSAVGVGLALNKIIRDYGESQLKIAQELDKQLSTLTALAHKWSDIAQAADSAADVQKLGQAGVSAIQAAEAEFNKFQNSTTAWWKQLTDSIIKGPTFGATIFEKLDNEQSSRLAENVQRTREAAIAATRQAEAYKEAFDKRKAGDLGQAVDELNSKIRDLQVTQKAVGIDNIESYVALGRQVEIYKGQLQEIIKLQEKSRAGAERKYEQGRNELSGLPFPTNADAYFRNLDAAKRASDRGDSKAAEQLQKTADELRKFAGPESRRAIDELDKLRQQATGGGSPDVVDAIERMRSDWR